MLLRLMTLVSPSDEAVLELIEVPLEGVVRELELAVLFQIQRVARDVEVPFVPPGEDLTRSLHSMPVCFGSCLDVELELTGDDLPVLVEDVVAGTVHHRREPELVVEHRLLEVCVVGPVLPQERRVRDDPVLILALDVLERDQAQVELVGQVMNDLPPGATAQVEEAVVQGAADLHDVPRARHLPLSDVVGVLELVERWPAWEHLLRLRLLD